MEKCSRTSKNVLWMDVHVAAEAPLYNVAAIKIPCSKKVVHNNNNMNLFKLPSGKVGKLFIIELTRLPLVTALH